MGIRAIQNGKWHGREDLVIKMACRHVKFTTKADMPNVQVSYRPDITLMGIINKISQIEHINYVT